MVLSGEGERARGGAPKRRGAARRGAGQRGRDLRLPRRLLSLRGQEDQGLLRGAEGRLLPRRGLHPPARRPAPGPPAQLRADLEHLPRPPDPRVRGAEVRRRHERAERVRAALRAPLAAQDRPPDETTSPRSARSAGSGRTCSRACCGCAAWSATRRAPTPRPSSAARPCSRDARCSQRAARAARTSGARPTS